MLNGKSPKNRWLHLILSSIGRGNQIVLIKLIHQEGLSPEILEKEELIKLYVIQNEEVEDEARLTFLKQGPSLHSKDIVEAV
jgi:hypothetical protein